MTWIPRGFATDVTGSEQVSQILCDPVDPRQPLRWRSTRERDAKMLAQGQIPAGDRHHGALGNSDPAKGRTYVIPASKPISVRGKRRS